MLQIFIEDPGNLKHPKNVKTNNNSTISHLIGCRVIPRSDIVKGWEKGMFWKIRSHGNLKCNKKVTVLKLNCFKKFFKQFAKITSNSSWFSRNSKNNYFADHNLMATSVC